MALKPVLAALVCSFCVAPAASSLAIRASIGAHVHVNGSRFAPWSAALRSVPVLPVGGDIWPVAIFWAYISVGTPPQRFPVAIDSGSMTLDIPLKGCDGCVLTKPNNAYDPAKSSTGAPRKCGIVHGCNGRCVNGVCSFSNTYETCDPHNPTAPCTISGPLYNDVVSFGTSKAVTAAFGAIDRQTSNFEQFKNIDGVVGMTGSRASAASVMGQLVSQGALKEDIWGLCLHAGKSNGTLTLGGVDGELATAPLKYTPNVGTTFYEMRVDALTFGGAKVAGVKSEIIIDTGTNILLLPNEAFDGLHDAMKAACNTRKLVGVCGAPEGASLFDGKCFDMTAQQLADFPPLTLGLPGVDLPMPPTSYLLQGYTDGSSPTQWCLAVAKTGAGGLQILGDTTLALYYTVFDNVAHRIGWAPVNKTACGSEAL